MNPIFRHKRGLFIITMLLAVLLSAQSALCMGEQPNKKAIVLAGFGTSYPSALVAITDIQKKVQEAFPDTCVRIAFTSNIIRNIWHQRQDDPEFTKANTDIPKEILYVKGPLATIADLQDEGYRTIVVQPLHAYAGEEYMDLCGYVRGLNAISTLKEKFAPFAKLVIGRPALGTPGVTHDYHKDMEAAAKSLASDVALAQEKGAALVYMGHGNEYFSTGIYAEFQQIMQETYPETQILIGTVEGYPSLDNVSARLTHGKVKKVLLKPLMVVAGDHANNDMAGDESDSWKSTFKSQGIRVDCDIHGLGENPQWANLYVTHIKETAKDNHVDL